MTWFLSVFLNIQAVSLTYPQPWLTKWTVKGVLVGAAASAAATV